MQMHLTNMIVVPKSRTSLFLNQRKELNSQLCHWRHQYSDEDWMQNFQSSSTEAERRFKNVRRQ
nr:IP09704p [Drosophila melanogaster]